MARESVAVEAEAEPAADETIDPPIVRRLVVAAECRAPSTRGARSIFDLADAQARGLRVGSLPRCADDDPARGPVVALREIGMTRCVGSRYPADRWTEEREEHERRRRARQRPPPPPASARTKSRKLLDLVGTSALQISPRRAAFALALARGQEPAAAFAVVYPASASWAPDALRAEALRVASDAKVQARTEALRKKIADGLLSAEA